MIARNKPTHARHIAGSCLAILLSFGSLNAAAATDEPYYTVGVISDAAKGRTILAEKYDWAITRLEAKDASGINGFYVANNLCVAYLKSGQFESAALACDTAVTRMKILLDSRHGRYAAASEGHPFRRYLALALSNRGVALVMNGTPKLARDDFAAALELHPQAREPEINLARLEMAG